ncbi:hypothetical protein ACH4E8_27925 [Streptomyces sp. NPDC017979]|uniref:hypothetical protein n=1 Tax=Streptomyces sp. NPDC017979 TaxID=3365024 RepID=UPI00379153F0
MRASRALAVAAVACATIGVAAPMAAAGGGDNQDLGPFNISVHPRAVHEGGTLTISVNGCNRGGTVTSNAFPTARLENRDGRESRDGRDGRDNREARDNRDNRGGENRDGGDNKGGDNREARDNRDGRERGELVAFARVRDNTAPGDYNLAVRCHGSNRVETAEFTVLRGRGAHGGLGGTVAPTTAEMTVGGGLVAVALGGGAFALTRRRGAAGGRA